MSEFLEWFTEPFFAGFEIFVEHLLPRRGVYECSFCNDPVQVEDDRKEFGLKGHIVKIKIGKRFEGIYFYSSFKSIPVKIFNP